jgi:hypothetical protein
VTPTHPASAGAAHWQGHAGEPASLSAHCCRPQCEMLQSAHSEPSSGPVPQGPAALAPWTQARPPESARTDKVIIYYCLFQLLKQVILIKFGLSGLPNYEIEHSNAWNICKILMKYGKVNMDAKQVLFHSSHESQKSPKFYFYMCCYKHHLVIKYMEWLWSSQNYFTVKIQGSHAIWL